MTHLNLNTNRSNRSQESGIGNNNASTETKDVKEITENPRVDELSIRDLQTTFSSLYEQLLQKTEQLRVLMDKLSGNSVSLGVMSFESVDPTSPDAKDILSKNIETVKKELRTIEAKIINTSIELITKEGELQNLKENARALDEELENNEQLYRDLCKHYGIPEDIIAEQGMVVCQKTDLNSQIGFYKNYIEMMKENIEKVNSAIAGVKPISTDDFARGMGLEEDAARIDNDVKNAENLLDSLCKHYGIQKPDLALLNMVVPSSGKTNEYYSQYIEMQQENLTKINAEIDRIQKQGSNAGATSGSTDTQLERPEIDMEKLRNKLAGDFYSQRRGN